MSGKLKECPFCGGKACFIRKGDRRQSNQVECRYCGAYLEDGATFNHGAAWNERPREQELKEENERLKKELEEMKAKYKHCCGTTI